MQIKSNILTLLILLTAGLLLNSCKKIDTPTADSKLIFGEWQYVSSIGGYSGVQSNTAFSENSWVEYTEKGKYKTYNNNKLATNESFKLETRQSLLTNKYATTVVYNSRIAQTFTISNDTLYLNDEAYDAFSYVFVKK